jgi:DNA-binding NtrC family response regulator
VLNHLSQLERRPVAMIATGYPSLDTALRAIDMPVAAYLIKPLDIDDLLARIRRVFDAEPLPTRTRLRHLLDSAAAPPADRNPVWFDQTMLQVVDLLEQLNEAWHARSVTGHASVGTLPEDHARSVALDALLDRIESGQLDPDDLLRLRQAIDHQTRRPGNG